MKSRRSAVFCIALASVLLAGCPTKPRTESVVFIDADDGVRALATGLRVQIRGYSAEQVASAHSADDLAKQANYFDQTYQPLEQTLGKWPFRFGLVPLHGDAARVYDVTMTALSGDTTIAVVRATSGFVAGKTLALQLRFEASCLYDASLHCATSETCVQGTCAPAAIAPEQLPELEGNALPEKSTSAATDPGAGSGAAGAPEQAGMGMGPDSGSAVAGSSGEAGDSALMSGAGGVSGVAGQSGAEAVAGMPGNATPVCGDGLVNGSERCDTALAPGATGACPKECKATDPCKPSQLQGSGCDVQCVEHTIQQTLPGDGCCPQGANANTDADCKPGCGNGTIENGETCDPATSCPTTASCTTSNACLAPSLIGSASTCSAACKTTPIADCQSGDHCCPSGCTHALDGDCSIKCGDGVIDSAAGETCEAGSSTPCPTTCTDNDACTDDMLTGSAANCNALCTHVKISAPANGDKCCPVGANANTDSDCLPVCGNNVVEKGELCDGNCPASAADCNDSMACTTDSVTGSACARQCVHAPISVATSGDGCCPTGANANSDSDCKPICPNNVVESGESCDGNCPASAADCDDNMACTTDSVTGSACSRQCAHAPISATVAGDGCGPPNANNVTDRDCAPKCPNNVVETGELCDGNCPASAADCNDNLPCTRDSVAGSACSRQCAHSAITGPANGDSCCPAGGNHNNDSDCPVVCGNSAIETGEVCDDGNTTSGDGCSSTCQLDDNLSTPGDDRAGYMACAGITCSPGSVCCTGASQGCTTMSACSGFAGTCDGPEDCPSGHVCYVGHAAYCDVVNSGSGSVLHCHRTADCPTGQSCASEGSCGSD
jgi:cysteine-rich repeat protein